MLNWFCGFLLSFRSIGAPIVHTLYFCQQEALEKCWAHSPLRAAARRIAIHQVSLLSRRTPPAHRCLQRRRRQRQCVTEGTAMAPWNGPNNVI